MPSSASASDNARRSSGTSRQIDANPKSTYGQGSPKGVRARFASIGGSSDASDFSSAMSSPQASAGGALLSTSGSNTRVAHRGSVDSSFSRQLSMNHQGSVGSSASSSARARVTSENSASPRSSRGNPIFVCIRVRPALKAEARLGDAVTCASDGKTLLLESNGRSKQVTVDIVIDSRSDEGSQDYVFDQVGRSLITSAIKDYNVCIFAYGHTGSGKTHTMLGHGEVDGPNAGLLPRFLREIFKEHTKLPDMPDVHYSCEFYEVYNETIRDLLAPIHVQGRDRKREVRVHPKYGVRIDGLSTSVVKKTEDILELVLFGNQMRTIAATTMNAESSRSHAIFTFRYLIETENEHHESVMTFVDLAGREDQAASQNKDVQFREMTFINKSLFHLSHLIAKLSEGSVQKGSLSDFRNSKLTLLLSQALVGNSCTALIATIAPPKTYLEDSISTLNFAQQVKRIKTKPIVNTKKYTEVVRDLEREVSALRKELSVAKTSNYEHEQSLMAAMALLKHYKAGRELDEASSADASQMRRRVSVQLGLMSTNLGGMNEFDLPKASSEELRPFLTKLTDDSALQGCCNFILMKEHTRLGGVRPWSDIVVQGVGIRALMCCVTVHEDKSITAELVAGASRYSSEKAEASTAVDEGDDESSDSGSGSNVSECWFDVDDKQADENEPRVLVNGRHLHFKDGPQKLQHGDAIILGYAHAFRLVVPDASDVGVDAATLARRRLESMDLTSAMRQVEEGTQNLQTLYPCLRQLSSSCSEEDVRSLMKELNRICPMIDEANTLTREILGTARLTFKLHIVTDFCSSSSPPQIVVCALLGKSGHQACSTPLTPRKSMGFAFGVPLSASDEDRLMYTLNVENFEERLNEMRDLYQSGAIAYDGFAGIRKRLQGKPFANPWRESSFADVKALSDRTASGRSAKSRNMTTQLLDESLVDEALDSRTTQLSASLKNSSMIARRDAGGAGQKSITIRGSIEVIGGDTDQPEVDRSLERDIEILASTPNKPRSEPSLRESQEGKKMCQKAATFLDTQEVRKLRAEIEISKRCLPGKADGFPRLLQRLERVVDQLSGSSRLKMQLP